MTTDKLFHIISLLELEVGYLRNVYWQYKANMKTEQDLIIAYNNFRSHISTICMGDD